MTDALRAISNRLESIDSERVVTVARTVLARNGVMDVKRLVLRADEYDDGYYYDVARVETSTGDEVQLREQVANALGMALRQPLADLSDSGPRLGRLSHLTLDLRG